MGESSPSPTHRDDAALPSKSSRRAAGSVTMSVQRLDHICRGPHFRAQYAVLASGLRVRLAARCRGDGDVEAERLFVPLNRKVLRGSGSIRRAAPRRATDWRTETRALFVAGILLGQDAFRLPGSCDQCGCRRPRWTGRPRQGSGGNHILLLRPHHPGGWHETFTVWHKGPVAGRAHTPSRPPVQQRGYLLGSAFLALVVAATTRVPGTERRDTRAVAALTARSVCSPPVASGSLAVDDVQAQHAAVADPSDPRPRACAARPAGTSSQSSACHHEATDLRGVQEATSLPGVSDTSAER